MRERNIHPSKGLWTHKDVTYKLGGTDHEDPLDYLRSHGVSEAKFRADVLNVYNSDSVAVDAKPQESNDLPSIVEANGVVNIEGYNVNLRSGPSTKNKVIRKLQKGETYKVGKKVGDWLDIGSNQWIYYDSSYIRYKGMDAFTLVGKRLFPKWTIYDSMNPYLGRIKMLLVL